MNKMRLLDDDIDIEQIYKKVCDDTLESLSKEMIKTRIMTKPQVFIVSTAWNKNDFLSEFTKMQPILTKHEDCVIFYLDTYYKPLKRRKTKHERFRI